LIAFAISIIIKGYFILSRDRWQFIPIAFHIDGYMISDRAFTNSEVYGNVEAIAICSLVTETSLAITSPFCLHQVEALLLILIRLTIPI
jgi:hypothetical protein